MARPFALGGKDGVEKFDSKVRYRSTLQNFLIDTGSEVILVDTGMPPEAPDMVADEKTQIYLGSRIQDYVSALKSLGYQPEQVTKILVTHKHADHTPESRQLLIPGAIGCAGRLPEVGCVLFPLWNVFPEKF